MRLPQRSAKAVRAQHQVFGRTGFQRRDFRLGSTSTAMVKEI